jgi:hypothetical protein
VTPHNLSTKDLIKLLIMRDLGMSVDDIAAALEREGRQLSKFAVSSIRQDFRRTLRLLHDAGVISEPLAGRLEQEWGRRRVALGRLTSRVAR